MKRETAVSWASSS